MLGKILPKYPDIRGKWVVEYSKDIILSGHLGDHRLYFDRQFLSIAWGVFYWSLAGSNVKYIYDVRCDFLDTTLARIELTPPKKLSKFHYKFSASNEELRTESEKGDYIIRDHIIGLIKIRGAPKEIWGSTTSISNERDEVFVSLPYFSAVLVTNEQSSSLEPVRPARRKWKINLDWKLIIMIISLCFTFGILVLGVLKFASDPGQINFLKSTYIYLRGG
jgi:hypothetical protein